MDIVTQLFVEIGPFHWLALAALLIAIEMVMPTQYLIWPGISAAVVGLLAFLFDLGLPGEISVFAVLSAILVGVSHKYFPSGVGGDKSSLNQRTDQMVGKTAVVAEGFQHGQGAVTVGDTRWAAQSVDGADYAEGTRVGVVSAESTLLTVKRL